MKLYRVITAVAVLLSLSLQSHAQTTNYTYDALGRLVEVERLETGKTKTYIHDDAGNRQSVTQTSAFGTFSVGDASVTEGGVLTFTVTKTGGGNSHDVAYSTSNGSAGAGDYTSVSGTLTFDVNDVTKTVTVATTQDSTFESDETVLLNLTSASNGGIIADPLGVGTIIDNDNPPIFSINNVMATEGDDLVFTVSKARPTELTHDVSYATADGSATASSDYGAVSGTLSFAPSETSKTIIVPGLQDTAVEGDETFYVNLSSPTNGALLADDQGLGTINDNDAATGDNIVLTLVDPATPVDVRVLSTTDTIDASELSTGDYSLRADYTGSATVGSVLFIEDGVLAKTENYAPYNRFGDGQSGPLPGGAFTLRVEAWSGLHGSGTLLDEKTYMLGVSSPAPILAINDQTVNEDAGTAVFTVALTGAFSNTVTVDYATADNTAQSTSDYTATSGTLTFTPGGSATQVISVPITDDTVVEGVETFHVNLTNATGGAVITDSQGVGTINDNDVATGDIVLTLVDSNTNASLRALSVSDTISASELSTGDYGLLADYTGAGSVGSVRFFENGAMARNENVAPYSRFGDDLGGTGSIFGGPLPSSAFTVKVEVWSGASGSGTLLAEETYSLGVNLQED